MIDQGGSPIINATWNGSSTGGDNTETVNYGAGPYTIRAHTTVVGLKVVWSGDCNSTSGNGTDTADCVINAGIAANKNITAIFGAAGPGIGGGGTWTPLPLPTYPTPGGQR